MNPVEVAIPGVKPLIVAFLFQERKENPGQTDDQLTDEISGDIKHAMRKKWGAAVDILWALNYWTDPLNQYIRDTVASMPEGPRP